MAGITLYDVVKLYGDVAAVDGVSLDVRDGEFVALVDAYVDRRYGAAARAD
mgnify:CR=1 FL=1